MKYYRLKMIAHMPGILALMIIVLFFSCKSSGDKNNEAEIEEVEDITFESAGWKIKEGIDYPLRESMLKDLVYNRDYRKHDKGKLLELLGTADRIDNNHYFYRISQTRAGFYPLHTKTLVIKFTEEDKIEWMKIHE